MECINQDELELSELKPARFNAHRKADWLEYVKKIFHHPKYRRKC